MGGTGAVRVVMRRGSYIFGVAEDFMTNSEFVSSHLPIGLDPFPFPCIGNSDFTLSDSV